MKNKKYGILFLYDMYFVFNFFFRKISGIFSSGHIYPTDVIPTGNFDRILCTITIVMGTGSNCY